MSDKKHIDRIFQEKFKDFEVAPKDHVWKNIQKELQADEKDTKVIPAWYKWAGVAALLLILLTVGGLVFTNLDVVPNDKILNPENSVVDTELPDTSSSNEGDNLNIINDPEFNDAPSVSDNGQENQEQNNLQNTNTNRANPLTLTSKDKNFKTQDNSRTGNNLVDSVHTDATSSTGLANNVKSNVGDFKENAKEDLEDNNQAYSKALADNENNSKSQNNKLNNPSGISNQSKDVRSTTVENPLVQKNALEQNKSENALATHQINKDSTAIKAEESIENFPEKEKEMSIEEAIAEAEESKEKDEKEKLKNRWRVYANIAPVYYNSLGDGSHIDEQFVGNSKTGEVNTSYGVNVGYVINEKLTIRTGVNSLKLSYDTNDVILYETPGGGTGGNPQYLKNLTMAPGNESINAISADNLGVQTVSSMFDANAAISQRIGYYEVPLELEYTLVNKKFGIGVVGGFSTFFLNQNEVYSEFESYNTYIGEANNINNVSFSGNLGIGLNYKFSPKFKFNFEPVFKYQFGAYENTSGNFNPYILGVYTGFSFKF
ncbi:hypothetical protein LRR18_01680 [Mangrovimonas sp. AS39]|uniref:hypothetical protein n=1 Tax=Mangrovimonas futianensis TaxID=2895523 RepID=UPI001E375778|nr:hypothetical protein [Mangrovimonas futianensis]MCF1190277.1 hypothetical protein [Mangrovimonas futianensis]MCF1193970.1 hypothetical protein [Mangrovimonas futianensis]